MGVKSFPTPSPELDEGMQAMYPFVLSLSKDEYAGNAEGMAVRSLYAFCGYPPILSILRILLASVLLMAEDSILDSIQECG